MSGGKALLSSFLQAGENSLSSQSSRFWLPGGKMSMYYHNYGDRMPLRPQLSRFASMAYNKFLSKVPVLHTASMVLAQSSNHIVYALIVTGARYEKGLPEDVEVLEGSFPPQIIQQTY
jgi:hypothetical protein